MLFVIIIKYLMERKLNLKIETLKGGSLFSSVTARIPGQCRAMRQFEAYGHESCRADTGAWHGSSVSPMIKMKLKGLKPAGPTFVRHTHLALLLRLT